MFYKLYSLLLERFAGKIEGIRVLGMQFSISADKSYNTRVSLSFYSSQRQFSPFDCSLTFSYEYDWYGRRTGKIDTEFRYYIIGLIPHVFWGMTLPEKVAITKERLFS